MENNKMNILLARKLIYHASFETMQNQLEHHRKLSFEASNSKTVKTILQSIKSPYRFLITYTLLALFCIGNVFLFLYLNTQFLTTSVKLLPLLASILFPLLIIIPFGKKSILLTSQYTEKKYNKLFYYGLNMIYLLFFLFYTSPIYITLGTRLGGNFVITIQNVSLVIAGISVLLLGYLFMIRGIHYFFLLCNAYITTCMLFQVKIISAGLFGAEGFESKMIIVVILYLIALLLSGVWFLLLKKRYDISKNQ